MIDTNHTLGTRKIGLSVTEIGQLTHAAHLLRPVATTAQTAAVAIDFVYRLLLERKASSRQGKRGVVLVIDGLMDAAVAGDRDNRTSHECHLVKLSQIASLGLKFNIFLVAGAQDPKIGNLSGLLLRNIGRRLVGRVADSTASRVLAGREGIGCTARRAGVTSSRSLARQLSGSGWPSLPGPITTGWSRRRRSQSKRSSRPEVQELDDELLAPSEPDRGGNVEIPVDPYTLALYFYERKLSIPQARQRYHLSRTVHTRHRDFARELAEELRRLRAGQPSRSPHYLAAQGEQE